MLGYLTDQLLAGPGQVSQFLDRGRGYEAAADQAWANNSAIHVASLTQVGLPFRG